MTATPKPRYLPETLDQVRDPAERVERAAEFLAYAEARAAAGRDARNAAIRAARTPPEPPPMTKRS